jgi:hypothetical protein
MSEYDADELGVYQHRCELLLDALKEAIALLDIYYIPNSDGSTPTITKALRLIAEIEKG